MDELLTITDMQTRLSVPRYRVAYQLQAHGIKPMRRVGTTNLYDAAAMRRVTQALSTRDRRGLTPMASVKAMME